jgi:exosome complex component CSL4
MKEKLVLPGEFLSTEEEYVPGKNAYECEGNVCSGSTGHIETNNKTKEISVKPIKQLQPLKEGNIVYGIVTLVKENSLTISLCQPLEGEKQVIGQSSAMLPVRNVSREYVESLRGCFKIGDIVKARITKLTPQAIDVSTNEPGLGVVKGFCSRCRKPLHIFGHSLRCLSCGSSEPRKAARGYLLK